MGSNCGIYLIYSIAGSKKSWKQNREMRIDALKRSWIKRRENLKKKKEPNGNNT